MYLSVPVLIMLFLWAWYSHKREVEILQNEIDELRDKLNYYEGYADNFIDP